MLQTSLSSIVCDFIEQSWINDYHAWKPENNETQNGIFRPENESEWNLDYLDSLGLGKIVRTIKGPDNWKYKY